MPVMVIVDAPILAPQLAVSVRTLLLAAGLVPNVAVTPLGRPDAVRVTVPVNVPKSVTVTVSVKLPPGLSTTVDAEGVSLKPGVVAGGPTVSAMIAVDGTSAPELPVIVTEAVP